MKTKIILKDFGDLPSGAVEVTDATVPALPEPLPVSSDENNGRFGERLHHRYRAPFRREAAYERSGINE